MFSKEELFTIKWLLINESDKLTGSAERQMDFYKNNAELFEKEELNMGIENAQTLFNNAAFVLSILNKIETLSLQD